ncbi:hypothetical protein BDQ17DRAFT_722307 [Cyathus striatus]|nr:hypothetical protein BDQ17DRAFT_722307 [Cyathus striatus]
MARGSRRSYILTVSGTSNANTPDAAPEAAAEAQPKWELRPTWQRAGLCAVFIASGCGIAGGILHARSRVIRALTLTPRTFEISAQPKKPRQLLFMQTFDHKETGGFLIPLRICSLREGRRPSQLLVQIEGRRGAWELNLEDATIDGSQVLV